MVHSKYLVALAVITVLRLAGNGLWSSGTRQGLETIIDVVVSKCIKISQSESVLKSDIVISSPVLVMGKYRVCFWALRNTEKQLEDTLVCLHGSSSIHNCSPDHDSRYTGEWQLPWNSFLSYVFPLSLVSRETDPEL